MKTRERDALTACGVVLLDCEIGGTPPMIAQRKGVVFISGDSVASDTSTPVFKGFADLAFYLGKFGTALKMKISANHLVAVNTLAVAEALVLGTKATSMHKPPMNSAATYYERAIAEGRGEQDIAAMFEIIESAKR